jgi:hypothetical protein
MSAIYKRFTFEPLNVIRYSFVMRVTVYYSFEVRDVYRTFTYIIPYERFTDYLIVLTIFEKNYEIVTRRYRYIITYSNILIYIIQ